MSDIRKLFNQSSHYLVGHLFVMVAGFISFPVLTRILSVSDYGILGLISVTIFLVQAVAKLGGPHSTVRFYAESKSKNNLQMFYSTIFCAYGTLALIISIVFFVTMQLLSGRLMDAHIGGLLSLVAVLIFLNSLNLIAESSLRAEQRTRLYNFILIINRYGSLGLSILFLVAFVRNLYGFYIGQIVAASMVCLVLLNIVVKKKIQLRAFSYDFFKKTLKFGTPLTWSELGHLSLSYSDRYLIQHYLGASFLGIYTAGYNLTTYVTEVVMYPISYAIDPIYLNLIANKKEEEAKVFLSKSLRYFVLILAPIVFGTIATGSNLIQLLATKKYLSASTIIPYVVIGNSIYACQVILNAGIIIRRKTHILMMVKFASCILNLGLNVFLIPKYGIIGAAQATLYSYIFYIILITYYSFREFSFQIDWKRIALYVVFSFVMFLIIRNVDLGALLFSLLGKIGIGLSVYTFLILFFDGEIRRNLLDLINKFRKRALEKVTAN
jgi:O-antigen/teichoic acid export membrane protein